MIDRILNGKYKLIAKIGEGGMANVYKAISIPDGMYVAVKILKPEYSNDNEFIRRFKAEAKAAASLDHPNIVAIRDVGMEEDIHYIVMEYVEGITLKEYISRKGILLWSEAAEIAIQICSALQEAHDHGIVHRDIKPHNILYTEEKTAKVTDFGIARAASVATITMAGSTIGSVHYFSPEQARGGFTDEKSDIYSLGITLYEMVTGRVPFEGENLVSVALKHLQAEPMEPSKMFDSIPASMNDIIMKAIKKDPRLRYSSAGEMLSDLRRVIVEPRISFVKFIKPQDLGDTVRLDNIPAEGPQTGNGGAELLAKSKGNKRKNKKMKDSTMIWIIAVVCILIMLGGAGITLATILGTGKDRGESFTLSNYVGMSYQEVMDELDEKYQVTAKVIYKFDERYEDGKIIAQNPAAGKKIRMGGFTEVELTVSQGEQRVKIPQLSFADYRDGEARLTELGLVPVIYDEFNATVSPNMVTRTYPAANKSVKAGAQVILYRSRGAESRSIRVPNLIGKTLDEAKRELEKLKLKTGDILPSDGDKQYIEDQFPAAGEEAWENSKVNLYLKKLPQATPVPQIRTDSLVIELDEDEKYDENVDLKITILFPEVSVPLIYKEETVARSKFPLTTEVNFTNRAGTVVTVELDGKKVLQRVYN